MTPDQYRREGAEAMRAYIANGCDPSHLSRSDNPTEFHAGYRHAVIGKFTAIRAIDVDEVLARLPGRAGSSEAAWQDVTALPDPKEGPFMVSNLPNAVNSHGRPSHVFCVKSIHKDEDGSFCAFDGYRKIWGVTRYYPISSPALPQETKNDQ